MKNKFINELAHKLLTVASFKEMKGVLEDYSGFMGEGGSNESPKEIINSLGINKTKGYIVSVAYIAFLIISFFVMDNLRGGGFTALLVLEFIPLVIMSVVFFVGTYLLWGKKSSLVSKYSNLKQSDGFGSVFLTLIPTVIIIGSSLFSILSFAGIIPYATQLLAANIIDISFLVMLICGIIDLILFYLKGSKYFISTVINYCAYSCLVQLEMFLCSISIVIGVESRNILVVSMLIVEFIIFVIAGIFLNKKLGEIRK